MNIEAAAMVDFGFPPGGLPEYLDEHPQCEHDSEKNPAWAGDCEKRLRFLAYDYDKSAEWLWYQPEWLHSEVPLFRQRSRWFVEAPTGHPEVIGMPVLLIKDLGIGVATFWISSQEWQKDHWHNDPWSAKNELRRRGEYWQELIDASPLFKDKHLEYDRNSVFLAVQIDEEDLTGFCENNTETVASWFTAAYEQESPERQMELVATKESNFSRRRYERLFMRWTDALALYNLDTVRDEAHRNELRRGAVVPLYPDSLDTVRQEDERDEQHERHGDELSQDPLKNYRLLRCRAAQLFEHCLLARRIFRTKGRQISILSTKTGIVRSAPVVSPSWRDANKVLASFSQAEFDLVTAPPVRTVEAADLVRTAIGHCGIPIIVEDTQRSYDLLDRRLQWVRGQWLAVLAVFVFLLNTVIAFFKP